MFPHPVDATLLWRLVLLFAACAAFSVIMWQLVKYRYHWTGRERLFIMGTGLYAFATIVGTVEGVRAELPGGIRIGFYIVANLWIVWALMGPPSRTDDTSDGSSSPEQGAKP